MNDLIRDSESGWREFIDNTVSHGWDRFSLVPDHDPGKIAVKNQLQERYEKNRKANLKSKLFIFIIALMVLTSIFTLVDYLISKYSKLSSHSNYLLGILILSAIVTVSYIVISMNTEIKYDPNGTVLAGLVVGVIYCLFLVWANYTIYNAS
jgi:magnesium-transporting ATPase (P-type)